MRTTVHLDDDAYRTAVRHAKSRKIGLGRAISELITRGAAVRIPVNEQDGLVIFDPPKDLPTVTAEQIKRLAEEW